MTGYCWQCESREGYEPHPTAPNVMSKKERPFVENQSQAGKLMQPPTHLSHLWSYAFCLDTEGIAPFFL